MYRGFVAMLLAMTPKMTLTGHWLTKDERPRNTDYGLRTGDCDYANFDIQMPNS
jgi:hypothetical protein